MNDFGQAKATPDCLSHIAISELAAKLKLPTPKQRDHLDKCDNCACLLRTETNDVHAAHLEPLPPWVTGEIPRAASRLRAPWIASLAAALGVLLLVLPGILEPQDDVRFKGELAVVATLVRDGAAVANDIPLEAVGALQSGDQLVLRVPTLPSASVRVEARESGLWKTLVDRVVDERGLIPSAILITPGGLTLRVVACPGPASQAPACLTREYSFE